MFYIWVWKANVWKINLCSGETAWKRHAVICVLACFLLINFPPFGSGQDAWRIPSAALYLCCATNLIWRPFITRSSLASQQVRSRQLIKHRSDGKGVGRGSGEAAPRESRWVIASLYRFGQLDYDICKSVFQRETSEEREAICRVMQLGWNISSCPETLSHEGIGLFSEKERETDCSHW